MGQRLGLRVDKEDGEIFVLEVQDGLVQEWNDSNPDSQVWGFSPPKLWSKILFEDGGNGIMFSEIPER